MRSGAYLAMLGCGHVGAGPIEHWRPEPDEPPERAHWQQAPYAQPQKPKPIPQPAVGVFYMADEEPPETVWCPLCEVIVNESQARRSNKAGRAPLRHVVDVVRSSPQRSATGRV